MKWKHKLLIIGVILALIGLSFAPVFDGVSFWEWLWKQLEEKVWPDKEPDKDGEECNE